MNAPACKFDRRDWDYRAFTLVELLVVIAIIAVLGALLLPALTTAKDRSKTTRCANIERQLGQAFMSYLNDNNGFYPYTNPECVCTNYDANYGQPYCGPYQGTAYCMQYPTNSMNAGGWNYSIAPYLGCPQSVLQRRVACNTCNIVGCCAESVLSAYRAFVQFMACPSNPWPLAMPINGNQQYRLSDTSYQMNLNLFPETWRCGGASSCGASPVSPGGWARRVNIADINQSSRALLLGETPYCATLNNPYAIANGTGWGYYLPYARGAGITAEQVTNTTAWAGQLPDPRSWSVMPNANGYVSVWHGQGMNCLFVDGHVERVPKQTLLTYSVQKWSVASGPNTSPGGIFWTDGKGASWYNNQFPTTTYPN